MNHRWSLARSATVEPEHCADRRDLILEALAEAIVVLVAGEKIGSRWRIETQEGEYRLVTPCGDEPGDRASALHSTFLSMAAKTATRYVLTCGWLFDGPQDEAIVVVAVSHGEAMGAIRRFRREELLHLGDVEWLSDAELETYRPLFPSITDGDRN